jgi:hypothetical protein
MLKRLDFHQDNILAFHIQGKLDHDAFLKASEDLIDKLHQHQQFCIYIEIHEPNGIDFRVVWDSVRFAMAYFRQYLKQVDRIAVVSDSKWIHRITEFENLILTGVREKAFNLSQKDKAMKWIGKTSLSVAA